MLINQARNSTSLPTSTLSQIQQSMDRTRQLIGEAQQIAYNVRDIDRAFDQRYPAGSLSRSEEHTSELQSLMRISYAVFCLKKKKITASTTLHTRHSSCTTT